LLFRSQNILGKGLPFMLENKNQTSFKGCVPLSLMQILSYNQYNDEKFAIGKEHFMTIPLVIYVKKNFYLLQNLSRKIQLMQNAGLIHYWHEKVVDKKYSMVVTQMTPTALDLHQLSGVFQIWLIGCFVSLVVFVCEMLMKRVTSCHCQCKK